MKHKFPIWIGVLLCVIAGCAAKVDPTFLNTTLTEAENAVAVAQQSGAEDSAPQQMQNAVRLLEEARRNAQVGNAADSLDLATRARIEAQIAAAEAGLTTAEQRLEQARQEIVRAKLGQMAHQVAAAQARQVAAERRADASDANARQARGEADEARNDALRTEQEAATKVRVAEVQLAISKAEDAFQQAIEADSMTHAQSLHAEAERLLKQARALLKDADYDRAIRTASQAEQQARRATTVAIATADAIRQEMVVSQQQSLTEARVAVAKAQLGVDQALALQADVFAADDYARVTEELQSARTKLQAEQYEEARQLAEQAQLHAVQLQERTQALLAEQQAQIELEERVARAKDTLFKAGNRLMAERSSLNQSEQTQAQGMLAKAQTAVDGGQYDKAVAIAGQVNELISIAVARMTRLREKESQIAAEAKGIQDAEISVTQRGILVRFGGSIFATGSSKLMDQVLPAVKQLSQLLKKHASYAILIEGHTDNTGDAEYNLKLSQERADTFMAYLIDAARLRRGRLRTEGLGESQPIAANTSEEGRRQNRRIDVILLTREE